MRAKQQKSIGASVLAAKDIGASAKVLFQQLLLWAEPNGMLSMTQPEMATELGIDVRNVRVRLQELRKAGWLRIVKDPTDARRNVYELRVTA